MLMLNAFGELFLSLCGLQLQVHAISLSFFRRKFQMCLTFLWTRARAPPPRTAFARPASQRSTDERVDILFLRNSTAARNKAKNKTQNDNKFYRLQSNQKRFHIDTVGAFAVECRSSEKRLKANEATEIRDASMKTVFFSSIIFYLM